MNAYFETSEELRLGYSVLKSAGFAPPEAELLQEIAALKERLSSIDEESQRNRIKKIIREKQLQPDILLERQKKHRKG